MTSDLLSGGQASSVRLIFGRPEHSPAQWTPCSTPRGAGSGFPVADPTASCTSTTPPHRAAVFSLQSPRAEARGSQGPSVPKRHAHVRDRERSWRGELSPRLQSPVVLSQGPEITCCTPGPRAAWGKCQLERCWRWDLDRNKCCEIIMLLAGGWRPRLKSFSPPTPCPSLHSPYVKMCIMYL